eukprot:g9310.t1
MNTMIFVENRKVKIKKLKSRKNGDRWLVYLLYRCAKYGPAEPAGGWSGTFLPGSKENEGMAWWVIVLVVILLAVFLLCIGWLRYRGCRAIRSSFLFSRTVDANPAGQQPREQPVLSSEGFPGSEMSMLSLSPIEDNSPNNSEENTPAIFTPEMGVHVLSDSLKDEGMLFPHAQAVDSTVFANRPIQHSGRMQTRALHNVPAAMSFSHNGPAAAARWLPKVQSIDSPSPSPVLFPRIKPPSLSSPHLLHATYSPVLTSKKTQQLHSRNAITPTYSPLLANRLAGNRSSNMTPTYSPILAGRTTLRSSNITPTMSPVMTNRSYSTTTVARWFPNQCVQTADSPIMFSRGRIPTRSSSRSSSPSPELHSIDSPILSNRHYMNNNNDNNNNDRNQQHEGTKDDSPVMNYTYRIERKRKGQSERWFNKRWFPQMTAADSPLGLRDHHSTLQRDESQSSIGTPRSTASGHSGPLPPLKQVDSPSHSEHSRTSLKHSPVTPVQWFSSPSALTSSPMAQLHRKQSLSRRSFTYAGDQSGCSSDSNQSSPGRAFKTITRELKSSEPWLHNEQPSPVPPEPTKPSRLAETMRLPPKNMNKASQLASPLVKNRWFPHVEAAYSPKGLYRVQHLGIPPASPIAQARRIPPASPIAQARSPSSRNPSRKQQLRSLPRFPTATGGDPTSQPNSSRQTRWFPAMQAADSPPTHSSSVSVPKTSTFASVESDSSPEPDSRHTPEFRFTVAPPFPGDNSSNSNIINAAGVGLEASQSYIEDSSFESSSDYASQSYIEDSSSESSSDYARPMITVSSIPPTETGPPKKEKSRFSSRSSSRRARLRRVRRTSPKTSDTSPIGSTRRVDSISSTLLKLQSLASRGIAWSPRRSPRTLPTQRVLPASAAAGTGTNLKQSSPKQSSLTPSPSTSPPLSARSTAPKASSPVTKERLAALKCSSSSDKSEDVSTTPEQCTRQPIEEELPTNETDSLPRAGSMPDTVLKTYRES